ncbi:hypothetical protein HK100_002348 [Physocladia obscura]|uniref:SF3 helicase domain-containing protein n=1 Tax=Physocladia obscura TaxID=109957 RepID=A0AAD5XDW7_9FUNG|nr:hypothetical protein HK100_002348 [Physocladia obscura]
MGFLASISADEPNLNYLLTSLAATLDGSNMRQCHIWTGIGSNGKQMLCSLMYLAFGKNSDNYGHQMKVEMLTCNAPNPKCPMPSVLSHCGKRVVCYLEPEKGSKIRGGILKVLIGGDVLSCNAIPALDATDQNPIGPFEKQKVRDLQHQIKCWGPQFMLILLDCYNKIYKVNDGLVPREEVLTFTNNICGENDTLLNNYEKTTDKNAGVGQVAMTMLYKQTAEHLQTQPNLKLAVKRVQILSPDDEMAPTQQPEVAIAAINDNR